MGARVAARALPRVHFSIGVLAIGQRSTDTSRACCARLAKQVFGGARPESERLPLEIEGYRVRSG